MNIQWLGHSAFRLVESTGTTIITDVEHILRGYENIKGKLTNVGAKIELKEI